MKARALLKFAAPLLLVALFAASAAADQNEREPNSDRASANGPIVFDETLRGAFREDPDPFLADYWSFSAVAGDRYRFTATPVLPQLADDMNVALDIENAAGGIIATAAAEGPNEPEVLPWICPASGTYYLVVYEQDRNSVFLASYAIRCQHERNPPRIDALQNLTVFQGGASAAAPVATISDVADSPANLSWAFESAAPGLLTLTAQNIDGALFTSASADCRLIPWSYPVVLTVTDASAYATSATFYVTVQPNPPPALGRYPAVHLMPGQTTTVTAAAPPADANGNLALLSVAPRTLPAGGTLAVSPGTGEVLISTTSDSAVGDYRVTVTAIDACGASGAAEFILRVGPPSSVPVVMVTGGVTAIRGEPPSVSFVASVADLEDANGDLAVAAEGQPPGLVVTVENRRGIVWATAQTGDELPLPEKEQLYPLVLTVIDSEANATSATFTVTVQVNPNPLAVREWRRFE